MPSATRPAVAGLRNWGTPTMTLLLLLGGSAAFNTPPPHNKLFVPFEDAPYARGHYEVPMVDGKAEVQLSFGANVVSKNLAPSACLATGREAMVQRGERKGPCAHARCPTALFPWRPKGVTVR